MSNLTAEDIVKYIANEYIELSHDKVLSQRNHYITLCREWVKRNTTPEYEHIEDIDYDF